MARVYSLQLYADDLHEDYCGCFDVPATEPERVTLAGLGFGCWRDEDGRLRRSFFFADELAEQRAHAERVTTCYVEVAETTREP